MSTTKITFNLIRFLTVIMFLIGYVSTIPVVVVNRDPSTGSSLTPEIDYFDFDFFEKYGHPRDFGNDKTPVDKNNDNEKQDNEISKEVSEENIINGDTEKESKESNEQNKDNDIQLFPDILDMDNDIDLLNEKSSTTTAAPKDDENNDDYEIDNDDETSENTENDINKNWQSTTEAIEESSNKNEETDDNEIPNTNCDESDILTRFLLSLGHIENKIDESKYERPTSFPYSFITIQYTVNLNKNDKENQENEDELFKELFPSTSRCVNCNTPDIGFMNNKEVPTTDTTGDFNDYLLKLFSQSTVESFPDHNLNSNSDNPENWFLSTAIKESNEYNDNLFDWHFNTHKRLDTSDKLDFETELLLSHLFADSEEQENSDRTNIWDLL